MFQHQALSVDRDPNSIGPPLGAGFGGAIGFSDGAVGVTQQLKRQVPQLLKSLVGLRRVKAKAKDNGVGGFKGIGSVTEPATFDDSARGIGHRIEPQHNFAALEIRQGNRAPILIVGGKLRCDGSSFKHVLTPMYAAGSIHCAS